MPRGTTFGHPFFNSTVAVRSSRSAAAGEEPVYTTNLKGDRPYQFDISQYLE